jgi:hypothetical protein
VIKDETHVAETTMQLINGLNERVPSVVIPENVTRVKADLVELFSNAFVDGINKY